MSRELRVNLERGLRGDKLNDGVVIGRIDEGVVLGFVPFGVLLCDLGLANASDALKEEDTLTAVEDLFDLLEFLFASAENAFWHDGWGRLQSERDIPFESVRPVFEGTG